MWGERKEFTRSKVAENNLKVPKNGLLPSEQRFLAKLQGKFSGSTLKISESKIRQKKTTGQIKPVAVEKNSFKSNEHRQAEKPHITKNKTEKTVC